MRLNGACLQRLIASCLACIDVMCMRCLSAWLCQVPLALIEARVTHILWPPSRIQRVQSVMPVGRLLVKNEDALTESSHFGAF